MWRLIRTLAGLRVLGLAFLEVLPGQALWAEGTGANAASDSSGTTQGGRKALTLSPSLVII